MTISNDTQHKINRFAKEQAELYLDAAEMTYMEKLRRKAGMTKNKAAMKLSKFKNQSNTSQEAQNDMILYMNDYIEDLMTRGLSEQEAFKKANEDLAYVDSPKPADDLHERFNEYYASIDPADFEAVGLIYGGFTILGFTTGGLIGFIANGGISNFMNTGWIYTGIGIIIGAIFGVGIALIVNAIITLKTK